MTAIVSDASALLAAVKNEPFGNIDPRELIGSVISAVNFCEVLTKLHDDGLSDAQAQAALLMMDLHVVAFDNAHARAAALLRRATRHAGLSLGDRACLALGAERECAVVTADRVWAKLKIGVEIIVIR